jgi:hypothetical protein
VPIAILGLLAYGFNYYLESQPNVPAMTRGWVLIFFGAAVSIWSTCYTEFWKRRQFFLNVWWGMTDFSKGERERPEFKGTMRKSPIDDTSENFHQSLDTLYSKMAMGILVVLTMIMIVIIAVFSFLFFVKGSGEGGPFLFDSITRRFVRQVDASTGDVSYVQNEHFMTYDGTPIGAPFCGFFNAVQIFVLNTVYKTVALKLNDFENHRTESEYENKLIVKVFLFQFVNSFSSFIYIAFAKRFIEWGDPQIEPSPLGDVAWAQYMPKYDTDHSGSIDLLEYMNATKTTVRIVRGDCEGGLFSNNDASYMFFSFQRLSQGFITNFTDTDERELNNGCIKGDCIGELGTALMSVFISAIIIQNLKELGMPFIKKMLCGSKKKRSTSETAAKEYGPEAEAALPRYEEKESFDDYAEIVIQYGFVTLFVAAFPLTPLLAFLNNIIEVHVDSIKLMESRRPTPRGIDSIGSWVSRR